MNAYARSILNRDVRLDRRVAISVLDPFLDRGRFGLPRPFDDKDGAFFGNRVFAPPSVPSLQQPLSGFAA
jgi:hypothetical protein